MNKFWLDDLALEQARRQASLASSVPPGSAGPLATAGTFLQLLDALGRICFGQRLRWLFPSFPRQSLQVRPLRGGLRFVARLPITGVLDRRIVIAHTFELTRSARWKPPPEPQNARAVLPAVGQSASAADVLAGRRPVRRAAGVVGELE